MMRPVARKRPRLARRGFLARQFAPTSEDHAPGGTGCKRRNLKRRDRPTSFQRSFRPLAVDRAPAVPDRMHVDHLLKRRCAIRITDADVFSQTVLAPHLIAVAGICGRFFPFQYVVLLHRARSASAARGRSVTASVGTARIRRTPEHGRTSRKSQKSTPVLFVASERIGKHETIVRTC
jgi:hypothetical protein